MPPGREYGYATIGGRYHHPGQCREVDTPWITISYDGTDDHVDLTRDFNPYELAGLAMRDEVYEPEGQPLPENTPGYRRLDNGCVEAIVVIVRGETPKEIEPGHLEGDADRSWEIHYRVRPATPEEAAGVLIDEVEGAFDGRVS
jgi:hypothetical protein